MDEWVGEWMDEWIYIHLLNSPEKVFGQKGQEETCQIKCGYLRWQRSASLSRACQELQWDLETSIYFFLDFLEDTTNYSKLGLQRSIDVIN